MQKDEKRRKLALIKRGIADIVETSELEHKMLKAEQENRSLVVKLGVDPTAPDMHLGHSVPLMKLRHFQEADYRVQFLIGDFTARIGDPSERSSSRKALSEEEVLRNAESYKRQISKILDMGKTDIVYNSAWLKDMDVEKFIKLAYLGTINEFIKRRGLQMRLEKGETVSVTEFIYPFLQAYDSVAMNADVEVGGEDQLWNFSFTRDIMRKFGQEPQVYITLPLLRGTDGKEKMSKTLDNHISLDHPPSEMYGRTMSIPDELIVQYMELLTVMPEEEIIETEVGLQQGTLHPRDCKANLARELVKIYHGEQEAIDAAEKFDRVHKYHQMPMEIEKIYLDNKEEQDIGSLLVYLGMSKSKSHARNMVKQGGVRIDGDTLSDPYELITPEEGMIVNIGKRNFKQITYENNK